MIWVKLLPALRWYVKEYHKKCSIDVDFAATGLKERLPAEMETALYRIVQEALTNTARHSQAHKASIELVEDGEVIEGIITDDGNGFDIEAMRKSSDSERGLGLAGMNERAVLLDGSLDIQSSPGQGTTILGTHSPAPSGLPRSSALPETVETDIVPLVG